MEYTVDNLPGEWVAAPIDESRPGAYRLDDPPGPEGWDREYFRSSMGQIMLTGHVEGWDQGGDESTALTLTVVDEKIVCRCNIYEGDESDNQGACDSTALLALRFAAACGAPVAWQNIE